MRAFRQSGLGQAIFGLIVLTIILGFLVTGRGLNLASFEEDCAVEVGNHCVEPKEFYAAYGLVASIGLNERVAKQMGLKEVVARGLAERELLLAEAKRLGVATGEESVDTELLEGRTHVSLPADGAERLAASLALCVDGPSGGCEPGTLGLRSLPVKKNGEFDIELYKRMVRVATGRSPSQFKEMQQRELSAARVRELVTASVRVSEEEAFLSYARARSTATARVVTVDSNWFERWVTLPTAADIQSWKTSHEAELKASVERSKAAWKVGCPIVQEIVLEAQGEESQTALLDRGKALARLDEKGFEAAARKSSVVASAHLGGRIGCLDATSNPEAAELLVALQAVDRPGAITAPVTTSRGVTVLRLVDWVKAENVEALASEFHGYELTSAFLGGEAARKFAEDLVAKLGPAADTSAQTEEAVRATLARVAPNEKEHPGLTDPLRPR
ncbi:MAG TPA: SurA N-terminal domain-containing protein, partial [Polyangiaceae bacterium]|nr:SurA N-terminal domain-containing protein [Polyangiaceae bacterium]